MNLRNSILLTTAYCAQFSYPLLASELWLRLLSRRGSKFSRAEFIFALQALVAVGILQYQDGYVFLSGRVGDIKLRIESEQRARQKRQQIAGVVRLCKYLPAVVGVAVTGSVAVNQARSKDDLDFLIVTKPRRLWLVRAVLVGLSIILGKYRSRSGEHSSGWCFNMWLDSSHLALPTDKRTLYTAYEVLQADWVYTLFYTKQNFLAANVWVADIIPHGFAVKYASSESKPSNFYLPAVVMAILSPLLDILNYGLYLLQLWYMRSVMTREVVLFSQAYFHPRDTNKNITKRWQRILKTWQ